MVESQQFQFDHDVNATLSVEPMKQTAMVAPGGSLWEHAHSGNPYSTWKHRRAALMYNGLRWVELNAGDHALMERFLTTLGVGASVQSWEITPFCSPYDANTAISDWRDHYALA